MPDQPIHEAFADIAAGLTDEQREGFRLQSLHNKGFGHYLSTACYHEKHDYCAAMTGYQGEKRPSQCKFCDARCVCVCHGAPAVPASTDGPTR